MRLGSFWLATCVLLAAGVSLARGQQATGETAGRFLQQQRLADERLHEERTKQAPLQSLLDWQWGGWIDYYEFNYNDGVQKSRAVHRPSLAIWTRATMRWTRVS